MVFAIRKSKIIPPYFCFSLLLAFYLLCSLFSYEAVNIFQDGTEIYMNDVEFYMMNFATLIAGLTLLFFAKKLFKTRVNYIALVFALILLVSNTYAIFSLPDAVNTMNGLTYTVTSAFRFRSFFSFLNVILSLYILYAVAPQCKFAESGFNFLLSFVSAVTLAAILASYSMDKAFYKELLTSEEFHMWGGTLSFCVNKNTFGALILFGICCEIYLFSFDKKWWRLLLMAYYFVSVFFTLSKTSIVCAIFVFIVSISYGFIRLFVKSKKWWVLLFFLIYIGANAYLCYLFFHNETFSGSFVGKIFAVIKKSLLEPEDSTMGAREIIWQKLLNLVKSEKQYVIFGLGDASFPFIFAFASDTSWKYTFFAHNGFSELLGKGGLIRVAVYALLILYLFILSIRFLPSKKSKGGALYLIFLLTFLLHSSVESEYLLGNDFKSIIWSFLIALPLLSLRLEEKGKGQGKALIEEYCAGPLAYPSTPILSKIVAFLLSASLSLSSIFLLLGLSAFMPMKKALIDAAISLVLSIIFLIVRMIYARNDKEKVGILVISIIFLCLSFLSVYIINWYFSTSIIPYTITIYGVASWLTYISLLLLVSLSSGNFALSKPLNYLERAYRKRHAKRFLGVK